MLSKQSLKVKIDVDNKKIMAHSPLGGVLASDSS